MDERERQYGDAFIVLAVHYLLDADNRDDSQIMMCIAVLEYALGASKCNYEFKLLLIRLYYQLGAYQRALDLAETLDVRQIQHDTIRYFLFDCFQVMKEYLALIDRVAISLPTNLKYSAVLIVHKT